MFRARRRIGGNGAPRKVAGIVLAVVGIAVIADKIPLIIWWVGLGIGLIIVGWKLYTS